jgi:cellulose synthase/poly-beta-1,6-N-acetylglucosamine synthase-like glycosyltransferase
MLAAVVPAHNEEAVIGGTVSRLRAQMPPDAIFVLADNCTDDTAAVARRAGARVWERREPDEPGKGAALRWFLSAAAEDLHRYDAIAIFDADSVVDRDFCRHAMTVLAQGADAVQGFVHPLSGGSPAADLAAYSEILSQRVDDAARARLGWPIQLRGTGMAFRREVLESLLPCLRTRVEDVEMSLLLAAQGRKVCFLREAVVGDPKPENTRGVATQRARWLQGQREVLRHHGRLVLRLLFSGRLGAVSLVFATLLKPKTLVFLLKVVFLLFLLLLPLRPVGLHRGAVALAALALVADGTYYIAGLWLVDEPRRYAVALARAPLYLVMWMWSLIISALSRNRWLSVRRDR